MVETRGGWRCCGTLVVLVGLILAGCGRGSTAPPATAELPEQMGASEADAAAAPPAAAPVAPPALTGSPVTATLPDDMPALIAPEPPDDDGIVSHGVV